MSNDKRYDVRKVLDYIDIIDSANLFVAFGRTLDD